MHQTRQQLSLFIAIPEAQIFESVRQKFNPVQHALIQSHVTLCREDEILPMELVLSNLRKLRHTAISIDFGNPVRFSEGAGLLIPAIGPNTAFQALRREVLAGIVENPRNHEPHITLIHPRNGTCSDEIFEQIEKIPFPKKLSFNTISLIEQTLGTAWKTLAEFEIQPFGV